MRLVIPVVRDAADPLEKSGRPHKYIRRVRRNIGGKLRWVYYYPDEVKARQSAQAAGEKGEADRVGDINDDTRTYRTMAEFGRDTGLTRLRVPLEDLSTETIAKRFAWPRQPTVNAPPVALPPLEAPDPHGHALHPLRALDYMSQLIPPSMKTGDFENLVSEISILDPSRDKIPTSHGGKVSWVTGGGKTAGKINVNIKQAQPFNSEAQLNGGMPLVEHLLRGYAAIAYKKIDQKAWRGVLRAHPDEPRLTASGVEPADRFADAFTMACMYPQMLAEMAPNTYLAMRRIMGEDALPPLQTDSTGIRERLAQIREIGHTIKGDRAKIARLRNEARMLRGIFDYAPEDGALTWWNHPQTRVQTMLADYLSTEQPNYHSPAAAETFHPDDKFFEMNHGGRTLYMRIGPGPSNPTMKWAPGNGGKLYTDQIKEIYDENGRSVDNNAGWWYLNQDEFGDDHPDSQVFLGFEVKEKVALRKKGAKDYDAHVQVLQKNKLEVKLSGKSLGTADPVEIGESVFRERSGTMIYNRWEEPGSHLLTTLKAETPGTPAHRDALDEYAKFQPRFTYDQITVTAEMVKQGVYKKDMLGKTVNRPHLHADGTPKLAEKWYKHRNLDGSEMTIRCLPGDAADPNRAGQWFVQSPMWKELLTPNDEPIPSPEALNELCRQATEAGVGYPPRPRRTWVTVQADSRGDMPLYHHVQVEWDGRGPPKILGAEWKRRLDMEEPRLSDMISGTPSNPRVLAEKVKVPVKKLRQVDLIPATVNDRGEYTAEGARVVLEVRPTDPGFSSKDPGTKVIAVLDRVLPPKKKGESESPPGWDRMPPSVSEKLPHPAILRNPDTGAPFTSDELDDIIDGKPWEKLDADEMAALAQDLLPSWYAGLPEQRAWFKNVFQPAYKTWEETKDLHRDVALPERYVFLGEVNGGAAGKTITRYGRREVLQDAAVPVATREPLPLASAPLLYTYETLNERDGSVTSTVLRLHLPTDGSITADQIEDIPGIRVERSSLAEGYGVKTIEVDLHGFEQIRRSLGGVSMTASAQKLLDAHIDTLKQAAEASERGSHKVSLDELDPVALHENGVGLNKEVYGRRFELPPHQKEAVQKLIDNDGRLLVAHFMGTGKTVTGIVAAKYMLAQPDGPKKVCCVVPLNVVEQWRAAADDFDDGALVVGRGKGEIPYDKYIKGCEPGGPYENVDLVVIGPEYWTLHHEELGATGFDGLIVDEAHQGTKSDDSRRIDAVKNWNNPKTLKRDLKMLMLLTGTPVTTTPADMLPFVQMLSQDKEWGGMTRADFERTYLEASSVMAEVGSSREAPKTQIKASRRQELGAILSRWTHVALSKDVKGKILPATRVEESIYEEMRGVQATRFALAMSRLTEAELQRLSANGVTGADERAGLDAFAAQGMYHAKQIANCASYKPSESEPFLAYTTEAVDSDGKRVRRRPRFVTFGTAGGKEQISALDWLMKRPDIKTKTTREKLWKQWPPSDYLTAEQRLIYTDHFRHILGAQPDGSVRNVTYEEIAGTKITPAQIKAMKAAGWDQLGGQEVANPDYGPLGIRFNGIGEPIELTAAEQAAIDHALAVQNVFASALEAPPEGFKKIPTLEQALAYTAAEFGISEGEVKAALKVHPDPTEWKSTFSYGGVTVTAGDEWVSDKRGSNHIPYRKSDWDPTTGKPRGSGGFDQVKDTMIVEVNADVAKYGKVDSKSDNPFKPPRSLKDPELLAEWTPGPFRYESRWGEDEKGRVSIVNIETGERFWVAKAAVSAPAKSLFDIGMRAERDKFDVAMFAGNAKAEALAAYIEQFFAHTGGDGPNRERGLSIIAHDILTGCRVIESTLRLQGFRDVNEMIPGSPHYDPSAPGPSPNGKYFVTYIGSTVTGNRDLNIEIFRKAKDSAGRDTDTSMFVDKCENGRGWMLDSGEGPKKHPTIKMSQWSYEQREIIKQQFGISAPEAHYSSPSGDRYFYGVDDDITFDDIQVPVMVAKRDPEWVVTKLKSGKEKKKPGPIVTDAQGRTVRVPKLDAKGNVVTEPLKVSGSQGILTEIILTGDPRKMDPTAAAIARDKIAALQAKYEELVEEHSVRTPPITDAARTVFNNCEVGVLSDAAQVGVNLGHAGEMVMYDSLMSPMEEMQRMARSARMLPPAVADYLLDKYIAGVKGVSDGRKFVFEQLPTDPKHPHYVQGAEKTKINGLTAWRNAQGEVLVAFEDRDKNTIKQWVKPSDLQYDDGPFKKIKDQLEAKILDVGRAGSGPEGLIKNLKLAGADPADMPFTEVLDRLAAYCAEEAEGKKRAVRNEWRNLAARARVARNMGTLQAKAAIEEFRTTKMPGKAQTLLSYDPADLRYTDPSEGTYALQTAKERAEGKNVAPEAHAKLRQEIEEPVAAVRAAIESLSEHDQDIIRGAGQTHMRGGNGEADKGPEVIDPTEVYLSLRAQSILDELDARRAQVGAEMRRSAGGRVVTDQDIMNRVIDELNPLDRAVLKAKKYLVNIKRIGVSGHMPRSHEAESEELGKVNVPTGYAMQHPVTTERNVLAIQRARRRPVENLFAEIQRDVVIRTRLDHQVVDHRDIFDTARELAKALYLPRLGVRRG